MSASSITVTAPSLVIPNSVKKPNHKEDFITGEGEGRGRMKSNSHLYIVSNTHYIPYYLHSGVAQCLFAVLGM